MNPQPPELFPQRPVRSDFGRAPSYRTRRIITVSVIVIALAFGARMIFGGASLLPPGEIATIKGDGPWKKRPDQPGGIDIPNQDVQVYQALDGKDGTKPPVEHLLPPPETPEATNTPAPALSAPNSAAAPQVESLAPPKLDIDTITPPVPAAPVASTISTPDAMAPVPTAAPVAAIQAAPAPVAAPAVAPVAPLSPSPAPVKTAVVKTAATAPAKAKPRTIEQVLQDVGASAGAKTGHAVQLASVPDEASAQDMAQKLQSQYASILGSAQLHVVRADVAGKGIYYRIQSSEISEDRASSICSAIKKTKAGCILVRP